MYIAKVKGTLVSTHKNEKIVGKKILICQPLDEELVPFGDEILALDVVGAGVGDTVVVMTEGKSARTVAKTDHKYAPVDAAIAGIVDSVKTQKGYKKIR